MRKIVNFLLYTIITGILLTGCDQLDVVAKVSITSFDVLTRSIKTRLDAATGVWDLQAPDGKLFRMAGTFSGALPDFQITVPAAPFMEAGVDTGKLPERYVHDAGSGNLIISFDVSTASLPATSGVSPPGIFKELVKVKRDIIGYHEALDHYGIVLGDGNMFEWAKDALKNDKDLVFVLNPKPFIDAGLDSAKLQDWVFAEVPVKDESGKQIKVFKLLKPYNIQ